MKRQTPLKPGWIRLQRPRKVAELPKEVWQAVIHKVWETAKTYTFFDGVEFDYKEIKALINAQQVCKEWQTECKKALHPDRKGLWVAVCRGIYTTAGGKGAYMQVWKYGIVHCALEKNLLEFFVSQAIAQRNAQVLELVLKRADAPDTTDQLTLVFWQKKNLEISRLLVRQQYERGNPHTLEHKSIMWHLATLSQSKTKLEQRSIILTEKLAALKKGTLRSVHTVVRVWSAEDNKPQNGGGGVRIEVEVTPTPKAMVLIEGEKHVLAEKVAGSSRFLEARLKNRTMDTYLHLYPLAEYTAEVTTKVGREPGQTVTFNLK